MKIYEKLVIDMRSGEVLEEHSFEYSGPIAHCGGGGGEQTQTNEPSSLHRPYIHMGLNAARGQFANNRPDYYPGSTVAPLSHHTNAGIGMLTQAAQDPRLVNQGTYSAGQLMEGNYQGADTLRNLSTQGGRVDPRVDQMLGATIGGDYLGGGQFMSAYGDQIRDDLNSQFAGRSGSAYHAQNMARGLGSAAAQLYSGERDRQLSAAELLSGRQLEGRQLQMNAAQNLAGNQISGTSLVPALDASRYNASNAMLQAGSIRDAHGQAMRTDQVNRFNFNQNRPANALQQYMALINGSGPGSTTTTSGPDRNRWLGATGGAATGMAIGGPIGAGVGAVGGYYWG